MAETGSEPSMEDILASIKKIIADDSGKKLSPALPRHDRSISEALVLDEPDLASDDSVLELDTAEPVTAEQVEEPKATAAAAPIVSEEARQASRTALESLSAMIVKPADAPSNTLEGLVQEMLRPMLKDWLDANLPGIVEAVVAKEVARISGRTF